MLKSDATTMLNGEAAILDTLIAGLAEIITRNGPLEEDKSSVVECAKNLTDKLRLWRADAAATKH